MVIRQLHCVLVALIAALLAGPAAAQGDVRLMVLHDHAAHVVAEMIPLTIRGEYDQTVTLENMVFPDSEAYDWVQLTRDDWHKERVKGRLLQIFERKIALFPRQAGPLEIPPITHNLTVATDSGPRPQIAVTSDPVRLNIQPFPGGHRPLAASALRITDELSADPGTLRDGEVLVRRVTIEAAGTLPHLMPPRPDIRAPWLISFTSPEERSATLTPDGPVSTVVWEWHLRPRTGEPGVMPAAAFPWFDTDSRHVEVAPLKPIPFGFASFGANFQTGRPAPALTLAVAALVIGGGLIAGLAVMLRGQGLASGPGRAALLAIRRLLPSPQGPALRRAARAGDLPGLRAAADRHLRHLGVPGDLPVLAGLDRALYGPDPKADFDPVRWLAEFHRQAG